MLNGMNIGAMPQTVMVEFQVPQYSWPVSFNLACSMYFGY